MATCIHAGTEACARDIMKLHKLCYEGNLKKVKEYVESLEKDELAATLHRRRGPVFGYTPIHEAVASCKPEVLDYLLNIVESAHSYVNCKANAGYTPLHLAASVGVRSCVKVLLKHGADIKAINDYRQTPIQVAESCMKGKMIQLFHSEGGLVVGVTNTASYDRRN